VFGTQSERNETPCWVPIMDERLVGPAREAIASIASEMSGRNLEAELPTQLCDSALLFSYLAQAGPEPDRWRELAANCLNLAAERSSSIPASKIGWGLYGGLSGIGWAFAHVSGVLAQDEEDGGESEEDPLLDVDTALLERLSRSPWPKEYDLISGLVGIGVYFLERLPGPSAERGLHLVYSRLEELSEESWGGTTWYTPARLLIGWQLEKCPNGYYNLGVAHGVPGVAQCLAELAAAGVEVARATRLLEGAVEWLFAQRMPPDAPSRYPAWFVAGEQPEPTRVSWCYGDFGIAAVLHHAARRAGREDWLRFARSLLDGCTKRHQSPVMDAGLCHGAFGNAHIYSRVFQSDPNPLYREAANFWFERGLKMRRTDIGIGGFPAWETMPNSGFTADPGFLSGAVGVALALLSGTNPIEPQWDRLLLLSGCDRNQRARLGEN
jgi:lantibiotic biosynthesis protein